MSIQLTANVNSTPFKSLLPLAKIYPANKYDPDLMGTIIEFGGMMYLIYPGSIYNRKEHSWMVDIQPTDTNKQCDNCDGQEFETINQALAYIVSEYYKSEVTPL